METSYMNVSRWKLHIQMHANGKLTYKCAQIQNQVNYIQCMKFISVYESISLQSSGDTVFIIFAEYWCSHGCTTDGPVDACEQEHPDGYQSRWGC